MLETEARLDTCLVPLQEILYSIREKEPSLVEVEREEKSECPFPRSLIERMTLMIMMVSLCLPEVIAGHILLDFYADDAFITRREGKQARGVSLSLHLHSIDSI